MQDAAFIKAADPRPHRVLGLELLPFSIGHFILLQKHESVFVCSDKEPEEGDLLLAVLVCSQKYEEARKSIVSRWLPWFMKFWGWRCRKLDILSEIRGMKSYLDALENVPDMIRSDSSGQGEGCAPWINLLRVFLMADLHVSHKEAMDYSITQAQWDFWTYQALRGNEVPFVSDALSEAFKLAREELN